MVLAAAFLGRPADFFVPAADLALELVDFRAEAAARVVLLALVFLALTDCAFLAPPALLVEAFRVAPPRAVVALLVPDLAVDVEAFAGALDLEAADLVEVVRVEEAADLVAAFRVPVDLVADLRVPVDFAADLRVPVVDLVAEDLVADFLVELLVDFLADAPDLFAVPPDFFAEVADFLAAPALEDFALLVAPRFAVALLALPLEPDLDFEDLAVVLRLRGDFFPAPSSPSPPSFS